MDNVFSNLFDILNKGIMALNVAKQLETGSGTNVKTVSPVQLTPAERAAAKSSGKWWLIGGLAIAAGLGIYLFKRMNRKV